MAQASSDVARLVESVWYPLLSEDVKADANADLKWLLEAVLAATQNAPESEAVSAELVLLACLSVSARRCVRNGFDIVEIVDAKGRQHWVHEENWLEAYKHVALPVRFLLHANPSFG